MSEIILIEGTEVEIDRIDGMIITKSESPEIFTLMARHFDRGPYRFWWVERPPISATDPPRPGIAESVVSYGRSMISGRKAPADVVELRRQSCFAPCPKLVTKDGKNYCGWCLCSTWNPQAELETKLTFSYLECPLFRPGFSNAKAV